MSNNISRIIPVVVVAAISQRAINKSYVAERCHFGNSTCVGLPEEGVGVLALTGGFVHWQGQIDEIRIYRSVDAAISAVPSVLVGLDNQQDTFFECSSHLAC